MVSAVQEGLGPIDVLINNAGVFPRAPFLEMTEHDWDHVLDVNLKGACFCAQTVAKAMVAAVQDGLGPIDVLINNAGVFPRVPFLEMTERDWDQVLDVNLKGSCFCAQYVAKAMVAAGRRGSILNIASGAALRGSPRGAHYVASKGGILSLTRAMALELAPYQIRVNAIAPGLTDTAQPRYGSSDAEIVEMARAIPLGRMAQPDEIARAAVFLASENAGFVTGQTLHVNGGSYLA